jgi:hypothetical protein
MLFVAALFGSQDMSPTLPPVVADPPVAAANQVRSRVLCFFCWALRKTQVLSVVLVLQEATHILAEPGNLTPPVPHVTWIMCICREREGRCW